MTAPAGRAANGCACRCACSGASVARWAAISMCWGCGGRLPTMSRAAPCQARITWPRRCPSWCWRRRRGCSAERLAVDPTRRQGHLKGDALRVLSFVDEQHPSRSRRRCRARCRGPAQPGRQRFSLRGRVFHPVRRYLPRLRPYGHGGGQLGVHARRGKAGRVAAHPRPGLPAPQGLAGGAAARPGCLWQVTFLSWVCHIGQAKSRYCPLFRPGGRPMRIVLVTDAWPPQVNGVVRTWTTMQRLLTQWGHELIVVSPQGSRTIPAPSEPELRLCLTPGRQLRRILGDTVPDAL